MAEASTLTPMMRQYRAVKQAHPQDIVFFRMGDFYEMMYEDAVEASKLLGITLTTRGKGTAAQAPMCGVPHHAAESYIARLVQQGRRVAICEQMEDPAKAKGLVKREVVRVVTPGTLLDEQSLDRLDFHYLAVVAPCEGGYACALLEFSCGRLELCQFRGAAAEGELADCLLRYDPAEIVLPQQQSLEFMDPGFLKARCLSTQDPWSFDVVEAERVLKEHFQVLGLDGFGLRGQVALISVAGAALAYLQSTQKQRAEHIRSIKILENSAHMMLDAATLRNLELTRTLFDGQRKESLLGQMDLTQTPMGARLLKDWLLHPLLDLAQIEDRQAYVQSFASATIARSEIRARLGRLGDLDRLLARLAMRAITPPELLALGSALEGVPEFLSLLEGLLPEPYALNEELRSELAEQARTIAAWIDPQAPAMLRSGTVIGPGNHPELDELRALRSDSRQILARMEAEERERTGIPRLKIQFNRVFGYYIEISKAQLDKVPENYIRRQTLANGERYVTEELKIYEERILGAEERIGALEAELYGELLQRLIAHASAFASWAQSMALLDVHTALAELAIRRHYCRPVLNQGQEIVIREGRHPVIEALTEEPFVANDTYLNCEEDRLMIITGPNMGGKSTYLRQVALICLMAQMGSFVPAAQAELGLVDRIFTRVGASDQLSRGQSTFMVEMTETAQILHQASRASLIILDEIGRGTSTFDGLSIAWACAEYLLSQDHLGAKTLFATHYHEMTELEKLHPGVRNYHITVREWNQRIVFLRRIAPGCADQSYGIHVAQLAGLPRELIQRAREILANLERNELDAVGRPKLARGVEPAESQEIQLSLFAAEPSAMERELKALDLDELSPRQAHDLLRSWQNSLS